MLDQYLKQIKPVNRRIKDQIQTNFDQLAKPLRSLGKLESHWSQIGGIQSSLKPSISKKALVIMCADNGVVAEGISQCGQEVTRVVTENFTQGKACINQFAKVAGADLFPVNIGIAGELDNQQVIDKCIRRGTGNIYKECAMSKQEAEKAIIVGIEMVKELSQSGYGIIATGEMGIGNTTTTSAIASVLLDKDPDFVTGKGAGLSDHALEHKVHVINKAIDLHQPDKTDAIDILCKIGGLDIAGMTGLYIGGAVYGLPIVVDGIISSISACLATLLDDQVRDYMIASHVSKEPCGHLLLDQLSLDPIIVGDMGLGEGTGALTLMPMLDMIAGVYDHMATFEQAHIEVYEDFKN